MARFVVEPAVAVKWFVPEENSSPAARLLDGGNELTAPDTVLSDSGKIIALKIRLGQLSRDEGARILEAVGSVPLQILPSKPLLEPSLRIAAAFDLHFNLVLGLVLGVQLDCRLVTASGRLYDKLWGTPLAAHVKWVGDIR